MTDYKIPYWYQQEAINAVLFEFSKGKKRSLIVAPTGSGKSVIISCFCEQIVKKWPKTTILIISDTIEILLQNHQELKNQLPDVNIGLYSSGTGKKTIDSITVAGIQSIYKKTKLFSEFNIIIVDEAHSVSFDLKSRYRKFLDTLKKPTIGLTATPFRLKGGYLHTGDNPFFQKIAYQIQIKLLQKENKLCQLITQGTENKLDASKIKKQNGDFIISELSIAFNRKAITAKIVKELLKYKKSRKKWLGFAINIDHCDHIAEILNTQGLSAVSLHSGLSSFLRRNIIKDYKKGKFQALVSVAMITTGFNVKDIDLIFCVRPTTSPVLHIQMPGRGMRTAPGKKNCLYLDFANNLIRNGPIDDPQVKDNEFYEKGKGIPLMKECPVCLLIVPIAQRFCSCGHQFQFKHNLTSLPSSADIFSVKAWHKITSVSYKTKINRKGIPYLKVKYLCGLRQFSEAVCFEHQGYAKFKAYQWWKKRWYDKSKPISLEKEKFIPVTCKDAEKASYWLKQPSEIKVKEEKEYPVIEKYLL